MKSIITLCLLTIAILSGCASSTGMMYSQQGRFATAPSSGKAYLVIIRKHGFVGAMGTWRIILDGRELAYLNVGEYVAKEIEPGEHILASASPTPFVAEAGQTYFYSYEPVGFSNSDYQALRSADALEMTSNFARLKPLF